MDSVAKAAGSTGEALASNELLKWTDQESGVWKKSIEYAEWEEDLTAFNVELRLREFDEVLVDILKNRHKLSRLAIEHVLR